MAHDPRRLERAQRLMRVQEQMRRVAEIDLAACRERAAAVEADRAALLDALGTGQFGQMLLGAANRRRAREEFDERRMIDRYRALYAAAMGRHSLP